MSFINEIEGQISYIKEADSISYVRLKTKVGEFTTLLIENPSAVSYLKIGNNVKVLFNASTVSLAKTKPESVTISNIFEGKIKDIKSSEVLSLVTVKCGDINVKSMITNFSVERLNLKPEDKVFVLIKATDVMLEV